MIQDGTDASGSGSVDDASGGADAAGSWGVGEENDGFGSGKNDGANAGSDHIGVDGHGAGENEDGAGAGPALGAKARGVSGEVDDDSLDVGQGNDGYEPGWIIERSESRGGATPGAICGRCEPSIGIGAADAASCRSARAPPSGSGSPTSLAPLPLSNGNCSAWGP